jgi:hypothetical protein
MTVYLICEDIDQGYHVVSAYLDETKAKEIAEEMNLNEYNTFLKHRLPAKDHEDYEYILGFAESFRRHRFNVEKVEVEC